MRFDLGGIDRRVIFLLVALALSIPLIQRYSVPPARMSYAENFFEMVQKVDVSKGGIAFVALDFGPNTVAENLPQSEVVIEHLMRRRIPFALYTQYAPAEPFLNSIPERLAKALMKESPGQSWFYGRDWVNLGFQPGGSLIIQAIPKSENLAALFKKDAKGNNLADVPAFKNVRTLSDIKLLVEFTGLVGVFGTYVQFFQTDAYRPDFGHGCTSITIPEAYIYMDSGQLRGLLEGVAGAAWYSVLLSREYPARAVDSSQLINTGLGVAHLVIILLVVLGNISELTKRRAGA